ncbi:MAG TPA: tetratricopeptide repeat protein [Conexibacter sp.]
MAGRWSSGRWETLDALTAAVSTAFVAAGVLAKTLGLVSSGVAIAAAAVGVLVAVARAAFVVLRARARTAEAWRSLLSRPPVRVREMAHSAQYQLGVDQESQEVLRLLGDVPHAPYVDRDVGGPLREALVAARHGDVTLVVVTGPSKAGKSRLALEAVWATLPEAVMLVPKVARPATVAELAAAGCGEAPGVPVVIWLDDLEPWARPDEQGLSPQTLERLGSWDRPVVVIATAFGKGIEIAGSDGSRFRETFRDLLERARQFPLGSEMSGDELERLRERFGDQLADRMSQDGIGEFMIAAPRLVQRLDHDHDCPEGQAVVRAAIDCRRAGQLAPVPADWLRALAGRYLSVPMTAEMFARGLVWATRPLYATTALLLRAPDADDAYDPYDFIVEYTARSGRPIDPQVWDHVIDACDPSELLMVATIAYDVDDQVRTERAIRRGDAHGQALAAHNLGVMLAERGDMVEAEAAYRRADERGSPDSPANLGTLLERRGEVEEAEAAYRRGDERGDAAAAYNLGGMLAQRGDFRAAAAAYGRAEDRGSPEASANLGMVYEDLGEPEQAEAAYRRGDEQGDASAAYNLGVMLAQRGALDEAYEAYTRADERGDESAAVGIGTILLERGDATGAGEAFRRGDERGSALAAYNLGVMFARRGEFVAAEAAFRRAEERGDEDAAMNIGVLREAQDDPAGAEAAFRRGAEAGNAPAAWRLAALLEARGDADGAAEAQRRAERLEADELELEVEKPAEPA